MSLDTPIQTEGSPDFIIETINNQILMMQSPRISNPVLGTIITKEEPKSYIGNGWCTDLVRYYREIPWSGSAIDWWQEAIDAGYTVGKKPTLNAVMVEETKHGISGHVALVIDVNKDSFTIIEQNVVERGIISKRTLSLDYPCIGFIY